MPIFKGMYLLYLNPSLVHHLSIDQVNSTEAFCNPPVQWNYATNGTSQLGSSLGQFPSSSSMSTSIPQGSYYPSTNPYARVPYPSGVSNLHYPNIATRQSLGSSFTPNLSDEAFDQYSIQSPQYLLPNQDPQLPTTSFTMQEMTRNWTPMGATSRPHQPSLGFEQDTASRYGNSGFPYYSSMSSGVSTTIDGLSLVPAMTGLVMSQVPVPSGRTLPNPSEKRSSQMPSTNVLRNSSGDFTTGDPTNRTSYKSTAPWGSELVVTGGTQRSTSNASQNNMNAIGSASSKSSGSPRCTQETTFGYTLPISHSPPPVAVTQASVYGSHHLTSSTQMSNQLGSVLQPSISSESLISSHGSSSNLYGYSMGSGTKNGSYTDSAESDGTLVSGQPYNSLRQMQPQHITSLEPVRRESLDKNSPLVQRGSITSVSNSKRF